ncbi:MAG: IS110 family transposase [Bacteroidetes bacterium]|nr:IS110 family transposase [Bacteroidota bacterium]
MNWGLYSLRFVCYTNNFEYYQEAKQLACYAGTAPFEHSSGTSVRGKTRVKMANQSLKTNLTLGAWSVIRTKGS